MTPTAVNEDEDLKQGPSRHDADWESLTRRERQILDGVVAGLSNPEIGRELFVSPNTVKFHVGNILRKLGLRSRIEVAVWATKNHRN
ncbi:hypothetical protein GCM10007304_49520 [Rhodococcoides trifolii]|uniref:HTH luxR-type domain-containing protein n=1 Tax=Rhodococcoides trifolii TaxID=908250 RepID=A0A917G9P2_9NOCA|nr:response regulator transcription factor [Rhodococcus trifolii]GGG29812.1 hypothetical protein GCM10007304_49520 [Rhodococcus trifolii]